MTQVREAIGPRESEPDPTPGEMLWLLRTGLDPEAHRGLPWRTRNRVPSMRGATTGEVTDHRKPMRVEDATPEQLIAGIVEMCDTDLTVLRFRGTGARRYSLPTV